MRFDILTLFPEILRGFAESSLIKKAQDRGLISINLVDIREFTCDKHNTADDSPFGGGPGMVMMAEPVHKALRSVRSKESKVILMSPAGKALTQDKVRSLSQEKHIVLLCGRYEGIDDRISGLVDLEISLGDYILSGGEIPAVAVVEAISRYVPGCIKEPDSVQNDSFSGDLLDYPHYTRPAELELGAVPQVLTAGNHSEIKKWRRKEQLKRTLFKRPDLMGKASLTKQDIEIIDQILSEI